MALMVDMGSANPGQIVLAGTLDGVDFAALRAKILSHLHAISGRVDNHNENLPCQSTPSGYTLFRTRAAWVADGALNGEGWETAKGIGGGAGDTRNHDHGVGTLAVSATFATTALSPTNNDQILVAHTNGDLTCDLIDGYAPQVVYDRYDGHYHYLGGNLANETLPQFNCKGVSGNLYFRASANADGSSPAWVTVYVNAGTHNHSGGNIALLAYNAPAGGGGDDAGNPKFAADFATGNIALRGDVNNIGIAQFKANYDAHNHNGTGNSGSFGTTYGGMIGSGGQTYFEVNAPGTWQQAVAVSAAHTHGGSGITVATPT